MTITKEDLMAEQEKNSGQDEVAFGFNLLAKHLADIGTKLDKLIELTEGKSNGELAAKVEGFEKKLAESGAEEDMAQAVRDGAKPKDLIRKFKISQKRAEELIEKHGKERRAPERVEVEAAEKAVKEIEQPKVVTVEMIRELAADYMKRFGTADLLNINLKIGGAKKLSEIDPDSLPLLYKELKGRIDREGNGAKAEEKPKLSLDDVKKAAKKFMDENGEKALAKLINAHGGKKLSEVPEAKLPALYEALTNA